MTDTHRAPVALVTGARQGIGRAAALALAARGFDVVVADIADGADTAEAVRSAGRRALFLPFDLRATDGHAALVERSIDAMGRIDCLVDNAGVSVLSRGDLLDVGEESWDRCLDTNLKGTFFLTQRVARHMLATVPGSHHRSIVVVSSISAEVVSTARGEYCISKAGLSMLAKLFAVRLAEAGIGVYEVRPGIIRTAMTQVAAARLDQLIQDGVSPVRRWGEPEDVGAAIATLASGALPFTVGQSVVVDGGLAIGRL
jgi:NAD(P)-dependent dehydrogenase (short-subunit alcohol dehydrogenase family)